MTVEALVGLLVGLVAGAAVTWAVCVGLRRRDEGRQVEAETRAKLLQGRFEQTQDEITALKSQRDEIESRREAAEIETARLAEQLKGAQERARFSEDAQQKLVHAFKAAGADALKVNTQQFFELAKSSFQGLVVQAQGEVEKKHQSIDALVKPIKEVLERQNQTLQEMDKQRVHDRSGLIEQFKSIAASQEKLGQETQRLVSALKRPEQRGRWGEVQLRNVVELAGMTKHCDFTEQPTTHGEAGVLRPDMVVRLPGGGVIVVDSKVALDAYLDALVPGVDQAEAMQRHARQVTDHARSLWNKRYWDQFERTPKCVVMFMPLESALMAALEIKPDLQVEAMKNHVLIATPTSLVALLRAAAFGWQQEDVAANAREIANVGRELYDRLVKFVENFEKIGHSLDRANRSYNAAVGSMEARLLPSARDLRNLHVTTERTVQQPSRISTEVRPIVATELKPELEEAKEPT